jgi:hypothetical protein
MKEAGLRKSAKFAAASAASRSGARSMDTLAMESLPKRAGGAIRQAHGEGEIGRGKEDNSKI